MIAATRSMHGSVAMCALWFLMAACSSGDGDPAPPGAAGGTSAAGASGGDGVGAGVGGKASGGAAGVAGGASGGATGSGGKASAGASGAAGKASGGAAGAAGKGNGGTAGAGGGAAGKASGGTAGAAGKASGGTAGAAGKASGGTAGAGGGAAGAAGSAGAGGGDTGRPGPSNTGVPAGTQLTKVDGDLVVNAAWMAAHPTGLPAGAGAGVIEAVDIFGTVRISVPGVTLRKCKVRGAQQQLGTAWTSLIYVTVGSAAKDERDKVVIEDCEVSPSFPSAGANGIYGWNFTARRNEIHRTVDGFGLHYFTHVEANWVHDLSYFQADGTPSHTDGTHNDVVQLHDVKNGPVGAAKHGGRNTIIGNYFQAFVAQDVGDPGVQATKQKGLLGQGFDHQAGAVIMVNASGENTITDNWFEGGFMPINAGDGDNAGMALGTILRNRFDRMRYDDARSIGGTNFALSPRLTIGVIKAASLVTGAGTADANRFSEQSTTPGVTPGAEVLVRAY